MDFPLLKEAKQCADSEILTNGKVIVTFLGGKLRVVMETGTIHGRFDMQWLRVWLEAVVVVRWRREWLGALVELALVATILAKVTVALLVVVGRWRV